MRINNGFRLLVLALALIPFALGCNNQPTQVAGDPPGSEHGHDHDHDHGETGPNGGHLIELGEEEYHAELVHDEKGDGTEVTVYILDGEAMKPVPIKQESIKINVAVKDGEPSQFELKAVPGDDPAAGASKFTIDDALLAGALKSEEAECKLNLTINGKQYVGDLEHHHH